MQSSLKKAVYAVASSALLAGAFLAGRAHAADQRIDEADAFVTKSIAILKALEDPEKPGEYGGHRLRALAHLARAQAEIRASKAYVDNPPPPPTRRPPPPRRPPPHPRSPGGPR
ncbi:MAG: hypothetical protein JW751_18170 [Polyangiaceae bacterium]|nr:hypothetical protein [Polyangiaceae bacterium]